MFIKQLHCGNLHSCPTCTIRIYCNAYYYNCITLAQPAIIVSECWLLHRATRSEGDRRGKHIIILEAQNPLLYSFGRTLDLSNICYKEVTFASLNSCISIFNEKHLAYAEFQITLKVYFVLKLYSSNGIKETFYLDHGIHNFFRSFKVRHHR